LYLKLFFRYLSEYERILKLPKTQTIMEQFEELKSNLTKLIGRNIQILPILFHLYQTFIVGSSMDLTSPERIYDYFPKDLLYDATIAT
jgi:hypothetical protein